MSANDEAVAALRSAAKAAHQATWRPGETFTRAIQAASRATDVVECLQAMIEVVVATEALHDAADAAQKTLRSKLAEIMLDTGATTVEGKYLVAHVQRRPAFVSVADEAVLPEEFFEQRRVLNKRELARVLKSGVAVAGATMAHPNEHTLVLRAKKNVPLVREEEEAAQ